MAKKFFVPRAHIVKGSRWYIDYLVFDPENGTETRRRNEFGLNDVPLQIREHVAACLLKCVKKILREVPDRPTSMEAPVEKSVEEPAMLLPDAVKLALSVKCAGPRESSHKNYKSISKYLLEWISARGYDRLPVTNFDRRHARAFFDYYTTRKALRGATINNRLTHLRAMWSEMICRDICKESPWSKIKRAPREEKMRRAFTPEERAIVALEIERTDYWLFRAVLLQYFCYIRPEELRRLKFRAFDFSNGTVKVESFEAKKWKPRWATIPKSILPYFIDGRFEHYPANYYIFAATGRGVAHDKYRFEPGPKPAPRPVAYRIHRRVLERLCKSGQLKNIDGLTWYSWKDTGISEHAGKTSPLATRDQAGHSDFDMTLRYYESAKVNPEYRSLAPDLF